MARPRTNDELRRLLCDELLYGNLIIAEDMDSSAPKHEVLVDVPGEGVVVVDEDEVRGCGYRGRRVRLLRRVIDNIDGRHLGQS